MSLDIQLSRYNINNINEMTQVNGVVSNGTDNLFPNYLDGLYLKSVTHQCIVNDLVSYMIGYGLQSTDKEKEVIIKKFLNKRFLKKLLTFKLVHNCYILEVIKNDLGKIVELNVLNPSQVRVSKIEKGNPCMFEWRRSWNQNNYSYINNDRVYLPAISQNVKHGIYYKYDNLVMDVPYGRPNYMAGLDAIELEVSIYMMHNHGAQNGMFPSMVIAKESSGDVELDKQDSKRTTEQASGVANAGKIITTYYPPSSTAPVFSTPNLTGIDKVYENQYQTAEAGILKAHSIPSPTLISGLNTKNSGFSSPTEELEWAKAELENKLIKPLREEFFEDFEALFSELGLDVDTLTFDEVKEEEVRPNDNINPTEMSQKKSLDDLINQSDDDMDGWELISSEEVDYEKEEELNKQIAELNSVQLAGVSTGTARPNAKSEQDKFVRGYQYKVRYKYSGDATGDREFCSKMLSAGKLYRKEDIEMMSANGVNGQFAPKGQSKYDIFLWKGGVYCHHKWLRQTFRKEGKRGSVGTTSPNKVSTGQAQRDGFRVDNNPLVSMRPIDTPTRGRYTFNKIIEWLKN